jgi:hypothetical protein
MGYFNKRKFKELAKSARTKKKNEKELAIKAQEAADSVSKNFEPDPNDTTTESMNEAVKAALIRSEIRQAEEEKEEPFDVNGGTELVEPSMGEFKKVEENSDEKEEA